MEAMEAHQVVPATEDRQVAALAEAMVVHPVVEEEPEDMAAQARAHRADMVALREAAMVAVEATEAEGPRVRAVGTRPRRLQLDEARRKKC